MQVNRILSGSANDRSGADAGDGAALIGRDDADAEGAIGGGRKGSLAARLLQRRHRKAHFAAAQGNGNGANLDDEDMDDDAAAAVGDEDTGGLGGVGGDIDDAASSALHRQMSSAASTDMSYDSGSGPLGGALGSLAVLLQGPGAGPGCYYYFKMAVDKQSHKGRMRWLSAGAAGTSVAANGALVTPLQPSQFLFVLARPLANTPITLSLYVTPNLK